MGGFLSDLYGSKPTVPTLPKLNLPSEQATATQANISNLPATEQLVGAANTFTRQQIQQMLASVIPNYNEITGSATTDIASMLKGEIPTDVSNALQTSAAARALTGGFAGSGMHGDLVARDLGLTSLNLMDKGITSAESWMSMMDQMYSPGMLNVSSMFITPMQEYQTANEQNVQQFQRQWMQSQISAMPDPELTGLLADISAASPMALPIGSGGEQGWAMGLLGGGGGAGGGGGGLLSMAGMMCWVAREVYGAQDPKWLIFRAWMIGKAPAMLRRLYVEEGPRFARWLRNKPRIKRIVRYLMDRVTT